MRMNRNGKALRLSINWNAGTAQSDGALAAGTPREQPPPSVWSGGRGNVQLIHALPGRAGQDRTGAAGERHPRRRALPRPRTPMALADASPGQRAAEVPEGGARRVFRPVLPG